MEHIDALEAVRRLTLERDALAQQVTYLTIQAADRERLAQQVMLLHTEVGGQAADLRIIAAERDTLAARVKRIQAHLNMLIKERDEAVLRANYAENARQAPERHERPETGTEPTEGTNGASRGCGRACRTCETCRHWKDNRRTGYMPVGYCHAHPPTQDPEEAEHRAIFPLLWAGDCCGEWQAE